MLGKGGSGVVYKVRLKHINFGFAKYVITPKKHIPLLRKYLQQGELQNGKFIAVKKVNTMRISKDVYGKLKKLFENEVALLMGLTHPNIVQLLSYCYEMKHDSLLHGGNFCWEIDTLLCLEYLPEGSLDRHISGMISNT